MIKSYNILRRVAAPISGSIEINGIFDTQEFIRFNIKDANSVITYSVNGSKLTVPDGATIGPCI